MQHNTPDHIPPVRSRDKAAPSWDTLTLVIALPGICRCQDVKQPQVEPTVVFTYTPSIWPHWGEASLRQPHTHCVLFCAMEIITSIVRCSHTLTDIARLSRVGRNGLCAWLVRLLYESALHPDWPSSGWGDQKWFRCLPKGTSIVQHVACPTEQIGWLVLGDRSYSCQSTSSTRDCIFPKPRSSLSTGGWFLKASDVSGSQFMSPPWLWLVLLSPVYWWILLSHQIYRITGKAKARLLYSSVFLQLTLAPQKVYREPAQFNMEHLLQLGGQLDAQFRHWSLA